MGKKILVTGGTGFLGQYVTRRLLEEGHELRVLSRSPETVFATDDVEIITGSVLDPSVVISALRGCEAIYHLAGKVSRQRTAAEMLFQLHVNGTRHVIEAAASVDVDKIIYVSTSGTIACSRESAHIATENAPCPEEIISQWPYYASKAKAEQMALEKAHQFGINLVCINPSILLGPGDTRLSSTEDVLRILQRRIPALPSGGLNFVDVRDVAEGIVAALEKGRPGERYLMGGVNWTLEQFIERIGELAGIDIPSARAPDALLRWFAYTVESVAHWFNRPSPLEPITVEMSQVFWYFDSSKASQELGFQTRDPMLTLTDTIEDLKQRDLF